MCISKESPHGIREDEVTPLAHMYHRQADLFYSEGHIGSYRGVVSARSSTREHCDFSVSTVDV
jgi:hypothetical protein